jgi:hypothetical protein
MACLELHQRYNKHVAERHIATCEIAMSNCMEKSKNQNNQSTIKKKKSQIVMNFS